ncbi:hypothetical protein [Actinopolymorpha pittospori]
MRVFRMVAGVLVGVLGLAAAGAGGLAAFWLVGPDDIVSARTQTLTSKGVAVATAPDLIDYYGSRLVVTVEPVRRGTELFVGVAHDVDLSSYLERAANTRIVEFGYPSTVRTREVDGSAARVVPPTRLDWWVTTASGSGARTLSWEMSDGPYDLAVMNADGRAGVEAHATVGIEVKGAFRASLVTFGVGVVLLACSILLLVRGRSRGRRRRGDDDESSLLWDGRDAWDQSGFWNAGERPSRGAPEEAPASAGGLLPLRESERERSGGRSAVEAFEAPRGRTPYAPPPATGRHSGAAPVPAEPGQPSGPPAAGPYGAQTPAGPPGFERSPYGPPSFEQFPPPGPRPPDPGLSDPHPGTDGRGWSTPEPQQPERFGAAPPGFDSASALPWRPAGTGRRRGAPDPHRPPAGDQRGGDGRPGPGAPPGQPGPGQNQRGGPPRPYESQGQPGSADADRQPPRPQPAPASGPAAPVPYTGRRIARDSTELGVDEVRSTPGPADLAPAADAADRDRRSAEARPDPASARDARPTGMTVSGEVALGADYDDPPAWLPGPVGPVLPTTKQQDGDSHG